MSVRASVTNQDLLTRLSSCPIGALLDEVEQLGLRVFVADDGRLKGRGSKDRLTADHVMALRQRKEEILAYLNGTPSATRYTLDDRARLYSEAFPDWPPLRVDGRWLSGMWLLGNNYKGSGYYGAYPPGYLRRITAIFPEAKSVLHLFSGSLDKSADYVRFDIRPEMKPDVVGDAHNLSQHFEAESFDLILADPPYSEEDAKRYGTPMVNRNTVLKEATKILKPGGNLVWLDQVWPMFRKSELRLWGVIGVIRSTNHRVRSVFIFEKLDPAATGPEEGAAR